jgi:CBS domain-containing protein
MIAKTVAGVMSKDPTVIDGEATCHDAALAMARRRVRHLPVVGGDGRLVGMLTDRDLRHHLLSAPAAQEIGRLRVRDLLARTPVRDVMTRTVTVTRPEAELATVVTTMRERRIGSLPVTDDDGHVVGMVTETDLLRQIVTADGADADVAAIIVSYP